MDTPTPNPDGTQPELDLAELEKQIQSLLGGQGGAAPSVVADAAPAAAPRDMRAEAIEAEPIDPLIREIDAALADDADALLRGSDGDVGQALRSVFDERALSGQEEEINRALIEAFGTSRVERPSFAAPVVTNPVPAFDGAARELPNDIPRAERDRLAPTAPANPVLDEQPTQAAMHAVTPTAIPDSHDGHDGLVHAPVAVEPSQQPNANHAPAAAQSSAHDSPPAAPVATIEHKPADATVPVRGGAVAMLLEWPLRLLSAPMRAMPSMARTVLSIAAITLVLWTPVAWWLAQRATKFPAVAPIHIRPAEVVASAEHTAEPAAAADKAPSGH